MKLPPLLGCLDEKAAEAYLLRPTVKNNKKKKKKGLGLTTLPDGIDKTASAAAERAFNAQQFIMHTRVQSGDLGGGWNPSSQLIGNNS